MRVVYVDTLFFLNLSVDGEPVAAPRYIDIK